ncbi:putative leucine-rich repeat domain superfamily [Plasmopara halstedii]
MSKVTKPNTKTKLKTVTTDEYAVTRPIIATNYGKACRAIGVHVNSHVSDILRGKEDDEELINHVHGIGPGFTNGPYTQLRYIRIWKQNIGNEGAAAFASVLQPNSGIKISYLELLDCGIGENGCKALAEVLTRQKAPGLLTLNLDYNLDIGDAGFSVLVDGLFINNILKQLHLDYCAIGQGSCFKLAQLISLPTCAIEVLSLNGNNIGNSGLHHLSLGLGRAQRLVKLNLSDNGIRNNIEALSAFRDALIRCKSLAHVDFTFNLIEPEGASILLPALAPENTQLQSFLVDASLPKNLFLQLNRSHRTGSIKKGKKGGGKKKRK